MWVLVANLLARFGLSAWLSYIKVGAYVLLAGLIVFGYFKWKSAVETAAIDQYRTQQVAAIIAAKDQEIAILNGRVTSLSQIQDTLRQENAETARNLQEAIDRINQSGTTNQALTDRMKAYLEELRRIRAGKP